MTFDGIGGHPTQEFEQPARFGPIVPSGERQTPPGADECRHEAADASQIDRRPQRVQAPKTMPNNFLAELWNRGSRYSSVAILRALIHLAESKTELDYSALDKESAFRLRKNLLDHGELPRAIAAVRKNVETWKSSERKTSVLEFLDGLLRTLKENFHELSSRTGQSGTKGRKPDTQEQDRLHSILAAAAYKSVCDHAGKRVRSPAELAQTELTKLDAKPALNPLRQPNPCHRHRRLTTTPKSGKLSRDGGSSSLGSSRCCCETLPRYSSPKESVAPAMISIDTSIASRRRTWRRATCSLWLYHRTCKARTISGSRWHWRILKKKQPPRARHGCEDIYHVEPSG